MSTEHGITAQCQTFYTVHVERVSLWPSSAKGAVTVGPGRNDRRPGDKGLSTKSLAYRRDESYG